MSAHADAVARLIRAGLDDATATTIADELVPNNIARHGHGRPDVATDPAGHSTTRRPTMHNRSHPVRQLLDLLALGNELTPEDLAELRFGSGVDRAAVERNIRHAAQQITAARAEGHQGQARRLAEEHAGEIIAKVGDALPPHENLPTDPRALAAMVTRR